VVPQQDKTAASPKPSLYDLTPAELESFFLSIGEKPYRARQVLDFLYRHPVGSIGEFTTLSKSLREKLAGAMSLAPLVLRATLEAPDGTIKHAYEVSGMRGRKAVLESVWMPSEPADIGPVDEHPADGVDLPGFEGKHARHTLCISSQLGCAAGCRFCATGALGLQGQLTAGEIVYQVVHCLILYGALPDVVLFMGMGEPMHNFQAVCAAVEIMTQKDALGFSPRRVIVSTSGELERLATFHRRFPRVGLAISLNAGTDEVRNALIPLNAKFDMRAIASFIRSIEPAKGENVTLEYVVLAGVNDTPSQIRALVAFLRPLAGRVKVNLIPFNPVGDLEYKSPGRESVLKMHKTIMSAGIRVFVRRNRGRGVTAACGQLAGKM